MRFFVIALGLIAPFWLLFQQFSKREPIQVKIVIDSPDGGSSITVISDPDFRSRPIPISHPRTVNQRDTETSSTMETRLLQDQSMKLQPVSSNQDPILRRRYLGLPKSLQPALMVSAVNKTQDPMIIHSACAPIKRHVPCIHIIWHSQKIPCRHEEIKIKEWRGWAKQVIKKKHDFDLIKIQEYQHQFDLVEFEE